MSVSLASLAAEREARRRAAGHASPGVVAPPPSEEPVPPELTPTVSDGAASPAPNAPAVTAAAADAGAVSGSPFGATGAGSGATLSAPPDSTPAPAEAQRIGGGHVINRGVRRQRPAAVHATGRRGMTLKPLTAGELVAAHWRTAAGVVAWLATLAALGGKLGAVFVCVSVTVFIVTHLAERRKSAFSSYSIFNRGFVRPLGQLTAADYDRMVLGREDRGRRGIVDDVTTSAAPDEGHVLGGGVGGARDDALAQLAAQRRAQQQHRGALGGEDGGGDGAHAAGGGVGGGFGGEGDGGDDDGGAGDGSDGDGDGNDDDDAQLQAALQRSLTER